MSDRKKLRSYLVLGMPSSSHNAVELHGRDQISREEIQEIDQLCRRVREIEGELYQLEMLLTHLDDDTEFALSLHELISYGFEVKT